MALVETTPPKKNMNPYPSGIAMSAIMIVLVIASSIERVPITVFLGRNLSASRKLRTCTDPIRNRRNEVRMQSEKFRPLWVLESLGLNSLRQEGEFCREYLGRLLPRETDLG